MKSWLKIFVTVYFLSACAGTSTPQPPGTPTPTQVIPTITTLPTEAALPSPTITETVPTPSPPLQPAQLPAASIYSIFAELDYGLKVLTVQQQITMPHPSDLPLNDIVLVVQPTWYPGSFQLDELNWADGGSIDAYVLDGIQLVIPLSEPWEPETIKEMTLSFTLNLPSLDRGEEFGPNPFGYTSRQINLTDWYPFIPPLVDGDWLVHNPWFYGEHLVYPVADYEVEINLINAPENMVIAANAVDKGAGESHQYRIEKARHFVWSASPEYHVFQEDVDGVLLMGYSFPYDIEAGKAAFNATVESYRLYSQIFGAYAHESLTMVQADFLHGMEYDGMYFLSKAFYNTYDGTPASYLVAIAAHETAHQWWFGKVANDQAIEPWLDEAICTFSERVYYEKLHPDAFSWWQDFRVDYYEPQGWVDMRIYDAGSYRLYRDAVYLNGMNFLTELRDLVGEDTFMAFLKGYQDRQANGLATANDFFDILREYSEADWSVLKAQYFQHP